MTGTGVAALWSQAPAAKPAPPPAAAPAAVPTAPTGPQPVAKIVEATKDVGKVSKGEKVKVDFEIQNTGDAELQILAVKPSCGCTVASYDEKVAPGKSGTVHAELETIDFQGPIAKTVTVVTNDPKNPRAVLTIKAKVEPHLAIVPGYARFIFVQTLDPGTIAQTVWALDYPDLKVLSVKSPYKFIDAAFHEAKEEEKRAEGIGRQWIVDATIHGDADVGALRDFLVIQTNHPKQPELRLPITGFVRPLMSVTPSQAEFGEVLVTAADPKKFALTLVNFGEDTIDITSVKADVPGVEATVKATEAGRRFSIQLTLTDKMPKGKIESLLRIETSSSKRPVLVVPFRGTVS